MDCQRCLCREGSIDQQAFYHAKSGSGTAEFKGETGTSTQVPVRRDINPMKIDEALRQLKAATKNEQVLTLKLQRITSNMIIERKQWISWYEEWIRSSIKEFTLRKIEYERKKLTLLERVRSDIRKADENGGLSRLGRHAVSNNNSDTSQTLKGDSWTERATAKVKSPSTRSLILNLMMNYSLKTMGTTLRTQTPHH